MRVHDLPLEIELSGRLLLLTNDDAPGMVGRVGTLLGDAGINIANMHVGQSADGASALMVVSTTEPAPEDVRERLRAAEGVTDVRLLSR